MSSAKRSTGRVAKGFVQHYSTRYPSLSRFAKYAEAEVSEVLRPLHLDIHQIAARPKTLDSAVAKIRRKRYGNPWRQLTDQVGVRVVTYYQEDVDPAAQALREAFDVDPRRSVDKRRELQVRQFGYRSVHLLVRFGAKLRDPSLGTLRGLWFEIQVRSILEHAWAEIEHEVCYKAGISFPDAILRRFGALAGTLELLESQFSNLRRTRDELIDRYKEVYRGNGDPSIALDSARLIALLETVKPDASGWRTRRRAGLVFQSRSERVCVEALAAAGVGTSAQLRMALVSSKARRLVQEFASLTGVRPEEVSHLAHLILAIGATKPTVLDDYPELTEDSTIRTVLKMR